MIKSTKCNANSVACKFFNTIITILSAKNNFFLLWWTRWECKALCHHQQYHTIAWKSSVFVEKLPVQSNQNNTPSEISQIPFPNVPSFSCLMKQFPWLAYLHYVKNTVQYWFALQVSSLAFFPPKWWQLFPTNTVLMF